jgi:tRNA (guanine37-N1)-methyltransferase
LTWLRGGFWLTGNWIINRVSAPTLRIDVVTIFPGMFDALVGHGISGRAAERALFELHRWNPRDLTEDAYRRVDDRPFGGGPGMVMMAEPLARTLDAISQAQLEARVQSQAHEDVKKPPVIYLSPRGAPLTQQRVCELAQLPELTLLCGRYEGVDERLLRARVDEEIAVGDFVVSGGELPAMMLIDAVVRWLPGAVQDFASVQEDSFTRGLLDCSHYTRPEDWRGLRVPEVLMGGHHERIRQWRRQQALLLTQERRPELLDFARVQGWLDSADERFISQIGGPVNAP